MREIAPFYNRAEYLEYLRQHCSDETASTQGRVVGRDTILYFLGELGLRPGDRVLEVGCGLGRVMQLIQDQYGCEVTGVDVCRDAITEIRRNRPHFAERVFVADAANLEMLGDATFDHVIFWGCFELVDQARALAEASRVVRPGGKTLICSIKNSNFLPDDASAAAAARAYREKNIPIFLSNVGEFEAKARGLGMSIARRFVFLYKDDAAKNQFVVDQGGERSCSECYYILSRQAAERRMAA